MNCSSARMWAVAGMAMWFDVVRAPSSNSRSEMDGGEAKGQGERLTSRPWRPAGDENSAKPMVVCVCVGACRARSEHAHVGLAAPSRAYQTHFPLSYSLAPPLEWCTVSTSCMISTDLTWCALHSQ